MANHLSVSQKDARDYLIDFAKEQNRNWLYKIIESPITDNEIKTSEEKEALFKNAADLLFNPSEEYESSLFNQEPQQHNADLSASVPNSTSAQAVTPLQSLHSFQNFKKLQPSLNLELKAGVNIIFGMNGSGKSSLTQAIKILSEYTDTKKLKALGNVHNKSANSTSFKYQLGDKSYDWSNSSNTGELNIEQAPLREKIKFFDSYEMTNRLNEDIKSENFIEQSNYKFNLFEELKDLLSRFQQYIARSLDEKQNEITQQITNFTNEFQKIHPNISPGHLKYIPILRDNTNSTSLDKTIHAIVTLSFTQEDHLQLEKLNNEKKTLEQANTEEGRILLTRQSNDIQAVLNHIASFENSFSAHLNYIKTNGTEPHLQAEIKNLQTTLSENNKIIFENIDGSLKQSREDLIKAAQKFGDFSKREDCPLCEQELITDRSKELFTAYHKFLNDELQSKIEANNILLQGFTKNKDKINKAWKDLVDFISNQEPPVKTDLSALTVAYSNWEKDPQNLELQIHAIKNYFSIMHENVKNALEKNNKDAIENNSTITQLTTTISQLVEKQYLTENNNFLKKLAAHIKTFNTEEGRRYPSKQLTEDKSKISKLSSTANKDLLEEPIKDIFYTEFKKLTGKDLNSPNSAMTIKPSKTIFKTNVGGRPVKEIFSEGELKSYALSLFMAEAHSRPPEILVFDDPATSYDSNHMSLFCKRIADFYTNHKDTQIIIFTHHWEFFQLFQNILNKRNLQHRYQYIILENNLLAALKSSNEFKNFDETKSKITGILDNHPLLANDQKEIISILLRRLIEHLVNDIVFARERSQYKPRTQSTSEFHKFRNIVPLTEKESIELGDMYFDLNPYAHADYRTLISSFDEGRLKIMLQKIIEIKEAIENRKGKLTVAAD